MKSMRYTLAPVFMACSLALPVMAQQTPAPAATDAASCEAQFAAWDKDNNGVLTEAEAPSVYARARIDGMTVAHTGYAKAEFLTACSANSFAPPPIEAGAPLEGANSFTEDQAKDRAIAWGYGDVSTLTKDDKGVWRGTASHGTAKVKVAIDYKGNVVSTPQ